MKNFKYLLMTISIFSVQVAHGACVKGNKVSTPPFNANAQNTGTVVLYLSNISDETINVETTMYSSNGAAFSHSPVDTVYGLAGLPSQTGGISMPPKSSGYVQIHGNGTHRIGFAEIEWTSEACLTTAMTSMIQHQFTSWQTYATMPVNGGKEF